MHSVFGDETLRAWNCPGPSTPNPQPYKEDILKRLLSVLATLLALPLAAGAAFAQPSGGDSQLFNPAIGEDTYLESGGSDVLEHLEPQFALITNYAHRSLLLNEDTSLERELVDHRITTDVQAALGLGDFMQLGLNVPVISYQSQGDVGNTREIESLETGDIRIVPKFEIIDSGDGDNGFGLAIAGELSVPTGNTENFSGSPGWQMEPRAVVEYRANRYFRTAANIGYLSREDMVLGDLRIGDEMTYGASFAVAPAPDAVDLELMAEVNGRFAADDDVELTERTAPVEAMGGARVAFGEHAFSIGAGAGLNDGYGTPDVRGFIGYSITPSATESVRKDFDGDGFADEDDKCPRRPEDLDAYMDDDGCPDHDDDSDQIADIRDACPKIPEDRDGVADADGCPEVDADNDGIADVNDECPMQPEDKDNIADFDGCPEMDVAVVETCEDEAMILKERIYFEFDSAEVHPRSFGTLQRQAAYLKDNPEITLVRVEGHADERGTEAYNRKLAKERAESARQYLINEGVAANRLVTASFGERDPALAKSGDDAWDVNRRVELTVLQTTAGIEVGAN